MYIIHACYYYFTYRNIVTLKNIYSRRRGFYEVQGIGEVLDLLNLPLDSKWYRYKNRIFIFRPKHKIASFVITQDNVYCPAKCFVDKQHYLYYREFKYIFGNYLIYQWCKYYDTDIRLKLSEQSSDRILHLVKNTFFIKPKYYEI